MTPKRAEMLMEKWSSILNYHNPIHDKVILIKYEQQVKEQKEIGNGHWDYHLRREKVVGVE